MGVNHVVDTCLPSVWENIPNVFTLRLKRDVEKKEKVQLTPKKTNAHHCFSVNPNHTTQTASARYQIHDTHSARVSSPSSCSSWRRTSSLASSANRVACFLFPSLCSSRRSTSSPAASDALAPRDDTRHGASRGIHVDGVTHTRTAVILSISRGFLRERAE